MEVVRITNVQTVADVVNYRLDTNARVCPVLWVSIAKLVCTHCIFHRIFNFEEALHR